MKLFYLGPEKSFSHQAAVLSMRDVRTAIDYLPAVPLENVFTRLRAEGNADDVAIAAYYNYLEGLVQESLDLIYEHQMTIVGSQRLPIVLCIGGYVHDKTPTAMYSHPKALAQCSQYLRQHYPNVPHIAVSSTTDGARIVSERREGLAIASREGLADHGLPLVGEHIGDTKHGQPNFTDFFVVAQRDTPIYTGQSNCLTMIAVTPYIDRVGLLQEILAQISYYGLNMAKIHSRPAIDEVHDLGVEPQMFYLEIACHKDNDDFQRCIAALDYKFSPKQRHLNAVRILGSYPAA